MMWFHNNSNPSQKRAEHSEGKVLFDALTKKSKKPRKLNDLNGYRKFYWNNRIKPKLDPVWTLELARWNKAKAHGQKVPDKRSLYKQVENRVVKNLLATEDPKTLAELKSQIEALHEKRMQAWENGDVDAADDPERC